MDAARDRWREIKRLRRKLARTRLAASPAGYGSLEYRERRRYRLVTTAYAERPQHQPWGFLLVTFAQRVSRCAWLRPVHIGRNRCHL